MKIVALICLVMLILVLFALVYYLLVGAILFKYVFSRKSITAKALNKNIDEKLKRYKVDLCWWDKVKLKKVEIQSFDGLKLCGRYIEANSEKTVIVVHGFGGNYLQMQHFCKFFYDKNFNVLAVDCRCCGDSEGKCITFGWLDRLDVVAWVNYINEKTPNNKIVLFGLSMGGATVCCAAGEKMKNVVAIISDCAYSNADRQVEYIMSKKKIPFKKLIKKHLYSYAKRLHNFDIKQADVVKQVKNATVPILFIHGESDGYVPPENAKILFEAAPKNLREQYFVKNADHALAYPVAGVLYEKQISDFLKRRTPLV